MDTNKTFRHSRQRERILDYVKEAKNHPTADMIYEKMRKEFPSISLGTVYRNLQMLSSNGTIHKITTDSGADRFDGDIRTHSHFRCDECGKIYDMEYVVSPDFPRTEHHITSQMINYRGICIDCLNETEINSNCY
ncbi:MAG TPA: transcriptional repressor [Clostridia bacterium]|jgi:Fe2+ or Zn2+ uptake regulation protein|nr:transcriptional repressor [Clostridia bacterium]HRX43106.1 transcriptional repressor [Clostridia bacterium]